MYCTCTYFYTGYLLHCRASGSRWRTSWTTMKALPLTKPSPRLPPPTRIRSVFCFVSAGGRAGVIFRAHWRVVSTQQTYIRVSRLPTFRAPRTSLALETSSTGPYPRARTVFAVQHLRLFLFSLFRYPTFVHKYHRLVFIASRPSLLLAYRRSCSLFWFTLLA